MTHDLPNREPAIWKPENFLRDDGCDAFDGTFEVPVNYYQTWKWYYPHNNPLNTDSILLDLGREVVLKAIKIRNTHNAHWQNS